MCFVAFVLDRRSRALFRPCWSDFCAVCFLRKFLSRVFVLLFCFFLCLECNYRDYLWFSSTGLMLNSRFLVSIFLFLLFSWFSFTV